MGNLSSLIQKEWKMNIGVVGAGVAGLTAAHLLSKRYNITLIEKEKELETAGLSPEEIEYEKANWYLLESQRYTKANSYDFQSQCTILSSTFMFF